MAWSLGLIFLAACLAPSMARLGRAVVGFGCTAAAAVVFVYFCTYLPFDGQVHTWSIPWVPDLGVGFSFLLDGLSGTFALLIMGIGTLVCLYTHGYMAHDPRVGRFYLYLMFFMGSMLGVVLADDLITMFIFWEMTSISSYLLIGWYHEKQESRDSALQALIVTAGGGLALMAGLLLLGILAAPADDLAAMRISEIIANLQANPQLKEASLYAPALLLILLGAFTKSAQFPFHFWLPNAMAAPTPVSSYLHSATMVKAGVYLLARMHPGLGDTPLWNGVVTTVGAVTMVSAAVMAACHFDLKKILAYSTVSVLGTLTMLLGMGTEAALKAMPVYLVAHALYKAALFQMAGSVDHEAGTRRVDELGGLRGAMPITATAGLVAAFSKAGFPLLLGFVGKELLYAAGVDHAYGWLLVIAMVGASVILVATALGVAIWPFWGPKVETPKHAHEAPWTMLAGPVVMAGLGVVFGLTPAWFGGLISEGMTSAIADKTKEVHLHLIPDFSYEGTTTVVLLSLLTMGLGIGLFKVLRPRLAMTHGWLTAVAKVGPERGYGYWLRGLIGFAGLQTRTVQHGYLRWYILVIMGVLILLLVQPALSTLGEMSASGLGDVHVHEMIVALIIVISAVATTLATSRLAAIAWLGATGVGVVLIFGMFGAIDLAITQILVETLTVILFVLVFYYLPHFVRRTSQWRRLGNALMACTAGALMTCLLLATAAVADRKILAEYFGQTAYELAQGKNVVNVILVDFRGLDTLGETVVVAVAGIGVYAMLKLRPLHPGQHRVGGPDPAGARPFVRRADSTKPDSTEREYL